MLGLAHPVDSAFVMLPDVEHTASIAFVGLCIGSCLGYVVGFVLLANAWIKQAVWPVLTLVFITPLIMVVPVLGTLFGAQVGTLLLVVLSVYYLMATQVITAISSLDTKFDKVIRSCGGSRRHLVCLVWLPATLPGVYVGLRASVPTALLAAILGEMMGAPRGLGVRLVTLMQSADSAGISMFCGATALLAWAGYFVIRISEHMLPPRLRASISPNQANHHANQSPSAKRGRTSILNVAIPVVVGLLLWELLASVIGVRAYLQGPLDVVKSASRQPSGFWAIVFTNVAKTAFRATLGVLLSVILAIATAVGSFLWPKVRLLVLAPVFISQTVPLVALVPLIAVVLHRGFFVVVIITSVATFFFMFTAVEGGLRSVPASLKLLIRSYGGGNQSFIWLVALPYARSYVAAGLDLTVPRMMAGAVLAEYLVSADGLGWLVYRFRATDFGVLWILGLLAGSVGMFAHRAARTALHFLSSRSSSIWIEE